MCKWKFQAEIVEVTKSSAFMFGQESQILITEEWDKKYLNPFWQFVKE